MGAHLTMKRNFFQKNPSFLLWCPGWLTESTPWPEDGQYGGLLVNNAKDFWPRWRSAMEMAASCALESCGSRGWKARFLELAKLCDVFGFPGWYEAKTGTRTLFLSQLQNFGVVWGPEKSPDLAKQVQTGRCFLWLTWKLGLHSWKYMGMGPLSYQIWGHEHPFTSHFGVNRRVPGFWLVPRSVYDRTSFSQPLPKGDPHNKQIDQAESLVFRGRVYDTFGNGQRDQGDDFSSWIFSLKIAIQFHIFHPGDPGTGWSLIRWPISRICSIPQFGFAVDNVIYMLMFYHCGSRPYSSGRS